MAYEATLISTLSTRGTRGRERTRDGGDMPLSPSRSLLPRACPSRCLAPFFFFTSFSPLLGRSLAFSRRFRFGRSLRCAVSPLYFSRRERHAPRLLLLLQYIPHVMRSSISSCAAAAAVVTAVARVVWQGS